MTDMIVVNGQKIKFYRTANKWICFFPNPFGPNWKYILAEDVAYQTDLRPAKEKRIYKGPVGSRRLLAKLTVTGLLYIYAGYAWDGPSGPTFDTDNFMRGSLIHDVLYQMMRNALLPINPTKEIADRILQKICIEDGMSAFRAGYVYWGVHIGGVGACKPGPEIYDEVFSN